MHGEEGKRTEEGGCQLRELQRENESARGDGRARESQREKKSRTSCKAVRVVPRR